MQDQKHAKFKQVDISCRENLISTLYTVALWWYVEYLLKLTGKLISFQKKGQASTKFESATYIYTGRLKIHLLTVKYPKAKPTTS